MMTLSALFLLLFSWPAEATAQNVEPIEIDEWTVPWEDSRPRDPYVDGRGRVWFVGQVGNYVAYLDPETGEFKRYDLEAGTHPHNLIVDERGQVWYAGNRAAHIGRLDPETGEIVKIPMPDPAASDPHTLVFDSRGDIWFTVQHGNFVGRLSTASSAVEVMAVPTTRARPYGIKVASNDRPWIVEFGSYKILSVDPADMTLREIELPRQEARPRRLAITSDGAIWYVDHAVGMLGRLDPASEEVREWPTPGGSDSRPYAMDVDDKDRLWFVETGLRPNRMVGFDPATSEFFSITEIGSGAGSVRHMVFHRPSREIWFGTDANTIGRARIP
jgi:virginiamycin B lyase